MMLNLLFSDDAEVPTWTSSTLFGDNSKPKSVTNANVPSIICKSNQRFAFSVYMVVIFYRKEVFKNYDFKYLKLPSGTKYLSPAYTRFSGASWIVLEYLLRGSSTGFNFITMVFDFPINGALDCPDISALYPLCFTGAIDNWIFEIGERIWLSLGNSEQRSQTWFQLLLCGTNFIVRKAANRSQILKP